MRHFRVLGLILLVILLVTVVPACAGKTTSTKTQNTPKTMGTIKTGDIAPDFEMRNQAQLKVFLSDLKGKKNVVLVFYPADFTPV